MLVILNPRAGRARRGLLRQVLTRLPEALLVQTRHPGHATALARAAPPGPVIAAGGDGTVAEVAAGLGADHSLGIIPIGTANVLAHEHAIPFAADRLAACLRRGVTRPLWPGVAHGAGGDRPFLQMLGAGLDARVVHGLVPRRKRTLGRAAYGIALLRDLACQRLPVVDVRIDGGSYQAVNCVVCKGRFYGGPYMLAPAACPGAPGFHVALLQGDRVSALWAAMALPLNRLPRLSGLRLIAAREIEIATPGPLQCDGDAAGYAPVRVVDAAAPLALIVPS